MNTKTNDILNDIIHLASQAIITDDEAIKKQELGDIHAAIASLMPVDHGDASAVAERHALPSKGGYSKYLTVADGVKLARFSNEHWVKLIAKRQAKQGNPAAVFEIYVDKEENFAQVFRDDTIMFKVEGHSVGHSFVESLAISCLKRYLKDNRMTMEKLKRKRARKAAEKAEAERAARSAAPTVAVSVGCPSLVPPCRLPAGFDGVEPTQEDLENA